MGTKNAPRLHRYLPQVILATVAVMVVPVVAVWVVRASGAVTSTLALMLLGTGISLVLGWVGRRLWEARQGSGDLLFGELMVWGFVRRWRTERRLANAQQLLRPNGQRRARGAEKLTAEREAKLLEDLAGALEARDPYTSGHSRRVARHAAMIAKGMGLPASQVAEIRTAAIVHDVGKIDIPNEILHKPDRLTDAEFAVVKQHPLAGAKMVYKHLNESLATIVAHHHERIDGQGYPAGLSGDNIPLGSRIIAVADTFDALTSSRPYREARPHKKALRILNAEAGTQLDPDAVRAFTKHYSGARPIAAWAFLTAVPQRLLYPLFGEGAAGGAISAAKVMAATAAAVGAGSAVAATSPGLLGHHPHGSPAQAAVERTADTHPTRAGTGNPVNGNGNGGSSGAPKRGGGSGSGSTTTPTTSDGSGSTPDTSAGGQDTGSATPTGPATSTGTGSDPVVKPGTSSGSSGSGSSGSGSSGSGSGGSGSGSSNSGSGNSNAGGNGNGNGNSGSGSSGSGSSGSGSSGSGSSSGPGNSGNAPGHNKG
jgi:hypothetical protein